MLHGTRNDITSADTAGSRFWGCTVKIKIHHQLFMVTWWFKHVPEDLNYFASSYSAIESCDLGRYALTPSTLGAHFTLYNNCILVRLHQKTRSPEFHSTQGSTEVAAQRRFASPT